LQPSAAQYYFHILPFTAPLEVVVFITHFLESE